MGKLAMRQDTPPGNLAKRHGMIMGSDADYKARRCFNAIDFEVSQSLTFSPASKTHGQT